MSDDKQVSTVLVGDFTMKDLETIQKFKDNGMLGLHTLTDTDCERMMSLYLDGKSYRQLAQLTKKKKDVILFLAHKFKWFELRKEYLDELHATLKDKVMESKLQSQEFLLELVLAYQKKISTNIHQYLRTDDEKFYDKVDPKDVGTVLKVMELLHKMNSENLVNSDKSLVGFNGLGEGMTITKTGANSVEITPTKSPSQFTSKLRQLADFKREQEKSSQVPVKPVHDIVIEEDKPKERNKNE